MNKLRHGYTSDHDMRWDDRLRAIANECRPGSFEKEHYYSMQMVTVTRTKVGWEACHHLVGKTSFYTSARVYEHEGSARQAFELLLEEAFFVDTRGMARFTVKGPWAWDGLADVWCGPHPKARETAVPYDQMPEDYGDEFDRYRQKVSVGGTIARAGGKPAIPTTHCIVARTIRGVEVRQ